MWNRETKATGVRHNSTSYPAKVGKVGVKLFIVASASFDQYHLIRGTQNKKEREIAHILFPIESLSLELILTFFTAQFNGKKLSYKVRFVPIFFWLLLQMVINNNIFSVCGKIL